MNGTESNKNMFWGLSMTAGNEYSQTVEKSFHISMAALDLSKSKAGGYSSVLLEQGKSEFVLCSLHPEKLVNQTLDLNFNEGEEVTFRHSGTGVIHLTGYVLNDMDDLAGSLDEFDSDGEPNENEMSDDEEEIGGKRKKAQPVTAPASKKLKADGTVAKKGALFDDEDDDDDDEDDEDFDDDDFIDDEAEEADSDEDEEEDEEEDDEEDEVVSKKKPLKQIEAAPVKAEATTDAAADKKKKKKNKKNKAEESDKPQPGTPRPATDKPQGGQAKKRVLEGNVIVEELKEGHGPDAKNGKMAHVYYTGRLLSNNKVFDQNNSGAPFKFRLDKGEVIKGWDIGLKGMRVGGKRRITIPPKMAYGSQSQSGIPANSTLVFDVELKALS